MSEQSRFVYVTYIKTTPEKLWEALTTPAFMRAYWFGVEIQSDWKPGSDWKMVFGDGRVPDSGEVLEVERPRRIVLKWKHHLRPDAAAEGFARCVMEIEPLEGAVKLTITHTSEQPQSKLIEAVSGGWPRILSNLKSLLETGETILG